MYFFRSTMGKDRGATILEFSVSVLFAITFIVGMMDLARYFAVRGALLKGAQDGLAVARVVQDFAIDTKNMSPGDPSYQRFTAARNKVIDAAKTIPVGSFLQSGSELQHAYVTDGVSTSGSEVMVLRPGDYGIEPTPDGHGTEAVYHPAICPATGTACLAMGGRVREANESMESLYRDYPIVIEMRGEVNAIMPFLGKIPIKVRAVGYRELSRRSLAQALPMIPSSQDVGASGSSGTSGVAGSTSGSSSSSSTSRPVCDSAQKDACLHDPAFECVYDTYWCVCRDCRPRCVADASVQDAQCKAQHCLGYDNRSGICACYGCCVAQTCSDPACTFDATPGICACVCNGGGNDGWS